MMLAKRIPTVLFWALLAVYIFYMGVFIRQTLIEVDGKPYAVLFDDAMISMQYARNVAQGAGAVFNAGGERVEGYSNPLWVGFMALFHLLPISPNWMGLPVQISGAVFLLLNLIFIRRIAAYLVQNGQKTDRWSWLVVVWALVLTAFYYPLNQWSLLGLEVSVLTLAVSAVVWLVLRGFQSGKFSIGVYVLLGLCTLVRIDMFGLGLATCAYLALFDPGNRRKHLTWGLGVLLAFMAGQTLLRYWYYGEWLPNTYYLKMTGASMLMRIQRGLYVFVKYAWNLSLPLVMVPFLLLAFRRDRAVGYLYLALAVQIAYSVYVGGDAWEHRGGANRFIVIVMPLFMILFVLAVEWLRRAVMKQVARLDRREKWREWISQAVVGGFMLLAWLNFNAVLDTDSLDFALLHKPSIYVIGQEKILRIALFVREVTTPDASVLAIAAGGVPYFSERTTFDLLGKSDTYIARLPMHLNLEEGLVFGFRPGHNKWDYAHSIGELKPDIIPEVWQGSLEEALPYLKDYTIIQMEEFKRWLPDGIMYVRTGSPNIRWDVIQSYILMQP